MMRALLVAVIMSQMGVIFGVNEYCGYARSTDTFYPTATTRPMLETLVTKPQYHGLPTSHPYNSHGLTSKYHVHSDLLHVADNGQITLSEANHDGVFGSSSSVVSAATDFCAATSDLLHSADVNGDGRDDLICQVATSGVLQVKYNLRNGYTNPATTIASGFVCTSQLLIGDFDGNHVEDFLCVERTATVIDSTSSKIYFNLLCSTPSNGAYHYHHRGRRHVGSYRSLARSGHHEYDGHGYDGHGYDGHGYHPKPAYVPHDGHGYGGHGYHPKLAYVPHDGHGYGGHGYHPKPTYVPQYPHYPQYPQYPQFPQYPQYPQFPQYPIVNANGMVCSTSGITNTFPTALTSCEPDAADILIGDVNGDGKDDLICHHLTGATTAADSISFSLSQGVTTGNVFATAMTDIAGVTCDDATQRVLVANVDGDSDDDLVCVDKLVSPAPAAPTIAFSAASTYSPFVAPTGTNCLVVCDDSGTTSAITYVVGDYNGDHYDDIMCRFVDTGTSTIHTDFIFAASP